MDESFECADLDFDHLLYGAISNVNALRQIEFQKKANDTKKRSKSRQGSKATIVQLKAVPPARSIRNPQFCCDHTRTRETTHE